MSTDSRLSRRQAVCTIAGWSISPQLFRRGIAADSSPGPSPMGLVSHSLSNLREANKSSSSTGESVTAPRPFLERAHALGAGGIQTNLGIRERNESAAIRSRAEALGMYIEADIRPPESAVDLERFEAELRTASQMGALAARTVIMPGRRYERFPTLEEFREYVHRGRLMLERAAPIAEKYKLPLAVENHKDQRIDERVALLKQISSEYVGTCVDTGNSVALLEDPVSTAAALAPWAFSVHLKDQALQSDNDGFLLADIPLGQGALNLPVIVQTIRQHRPDVRFSLELITRDPLKVPCLTDAFWATFPDVPGADLARTLRMVRAQEARNLQQVSVLSVEERIRLEERNIRESLAYARSQLGL